MDDVFGIFCGFLLVVLAKIFICSRHLANFFPRASERRVLPIVGVCISSSHFHIFSSSHLLIFTSSHLHIFSLHIFSSSHLLIFTSSHLHIFSSSHLYIFSPSHLLIFTSSISSCSAQPFRTKRSSIVKNCVISLV